MTNNIFQMVICLDLGFGYFTPKVDILLENEVLDNLAQVPKAVSNSPEGKRTPDGLSWNAAWGNLTAQNHGQHLTSSLAFLKQ